MIDQNHSIDRSASTPGNAERRAQAIWRPYLPEPRPAYRFNDEADNPEPVDLDVLCELRELCANFAVPPRGFRDQRRSTTACYQPKTGIIVVDIDQADESGMGGDDGYYVDLLHQLLHATGHPRR